MPNQQLLHLVIGGELKDVSGHEFRDLSKVDLVGAYANYADARQAWKSKAQSTVDNALTRYFIIHAHRLLDPGHEDHATDAAAEAAVEAAHAKAAAAPAAPAPVATSAPAAPAKSSGLSGVLLAVAAALAGAVLAKALWH